VNNFHEKSIYSTENFSISRAFDVAIGTESITGRDAQSWVSVALSVKLP